MAHPLWKTFWQFLKKQDMQLPYGPTVALLAFVPEKWEHLHEHLCTHVHSSFFVLSPNCSQRRCPSTGKWLNKLWFFTMGHALEGKGPHL